MSAHLSAVSWPLSDLDHALELVARRAGLSGVAPAASAALAGAGLDNPQALGRAIERLVSAYDLEVEPIVLRYHEASRLPAPMILRLPREQETAEPTFLVVLRRQGQRLTVLGRDRRPQRINGREVAAALTARLDAGQQEEIDRLLDAASVAESRRPRVRSALLRERLADAYLADGWRLVSEPGGDFAAQLRRAGIGREMVLLTVLHATQYALSLLAWGLIGRGALEGRTDWGWLTAWVLLLATIVPIQAWTFWLQGSVALRAGRLFKDRLLTGALRLDPEDVRQEGAGQLLGRVIESEAVETLALGGGLQAALACVEIVMAALVLSAGAVPWPHVAALTALVLATSLGAARYHARRARWSAWRLSMTHALVERVAGHRTRLAQESPRHWHDEEDRALEEYVERSSALDRWLPALFVALPRGWIAIGVSLLAPAFITGTGVSPLAISLGGIVLASLALRRFADGLSRLSGAAVAWRQAGPLFAAAVRKPVASAIGDDAAPVPTGSSAPVLEVRDVSFRYPNRAQAVLHGCTLSVGAGDRLLLEGPSGGGKSTFATLIAGLRDPSAGLILLDGLDRRTMGAHGWRRRVVSAPQFHENHVFCETFAFNLLMGRRWPATDADLAEAEKVARELGLGELLETMPAGLLQLVGEGGWQLSHGERSRLFMARALLQGGNVMILDESFAALDPENLRDTLECVLRRAPALIVIAHP